MSGHGALAPGRAAREDGSTDRIGVISWATTVFERRRPPASVVQHALAGTRQSRVLARRRRRARRPTVAARAHRQPRRRSRHRRRRLHGPVDGGAREAAQPRCARHARRGEVDRLGGVGAKRRVLRGEPHARARERPRPLARRDRHARPSRAREPRRHRGCRRPSSAWTFEFERNGALDVAVEPHQLEWLEESLADAAARGDDSRAAGSTRRRCRPRSPRPPTSVRCGTRARARSCTRRSSRSSSPASPKSSGSRSSSARRCDALETPGSTGAASVVTDVGRIDAARVVLATNVFPSLLKRNRLMTVPVYDYVLMTEPLTAEQLAVDRLVAAGRASATWRTSSTTTA